MRKWAALQAGPPLPPSAVWPPGAWSALRHRPGTAAQRQVLGQDQHAGSDLWYPLWDARIRVDHAVRTPAECAEVAGRELSAGVGLLDRVITGDAELVKGARRHLDSWRGHARKRLPELLASLDERLATFGDAAYLLEPDLKEARGGFRDVSMLRALAASWLTDRPHVGIRGPYQRLLDVRDALHLASGRTLDRLIFSETEAVATRLGYREADDLRRDVSLAARRIGHAVDVTVRAARQALPPHRVLSFIKRERKPDYIKADHGLIITPARSASALDQPQRSPRWPPSRGAGRAARAGPLPVTADNLGKQGQALRRRGLRPAGMRCWTCWPPGPMSCRSGRPSTSPDASADGFLVGADPRSASAQSGPSTHGGPAPGADSG